MRQAATLSSRERTGLPSPRVSLWLISCSRTATSRMIRWCPACWLARIARTVTAARPMTRAIRNAMNGLPPAGVLGAERGCWRAGSHVPTAERRVAGGVGADPGGGFVGGIEQAAAVKVGGIAGVAVHSAGVLCSRVRTIRSAWVSASQVSRSSGQAVSSASWLISTLSAARVSSRSAAKASSTASTSCGLGGALALGQFGPGRAVGAVYAVAAGGGQPDEHLPGGGLLAGRQTVVGALRAGGDGPFDAAGSLVVGQGESVPGPRPPGLVKGVRQQRQHARAGRPRLTGATLAQQDRRPGRPRRESPPCLAGSVMAIRSCRSVIDVTR